MPQECGEVDGTGGYDRPKLPRAGDLVYTTAWQSTDALTYGF
jgi:hypothetical protein